MDFISERIGKLLSDIGQLRYTNRQALGPFRMAPGKQAPAEGWTHFAPGDTWGGHRRWFWFETTLSVDKQWEGKPLLFCLRTGREGAWDATNPQFALYVDDVLWQGLDVNHTEALIAEKAELSREYTIRLSAFTGDDNQHLLLEGSACVVDREIERFYYDLSVPYQAALVRTDNDECARFTFQCLNEALNLVDLRETYSDAFYASLQKAARAFRKAYFATSAPAEAPTVYTVGHTHIDVAWLWTLAVTRDKAQRSFATALRLMEEYPEFTFLSSQPQLYEFVRQDAPSLWEGIAARVAQGRWEAEGGMWVEADCNIAGGEALVRQFLYGKAFFKRYFNKDNQILWLPDVFGYSAALPQIMQKCGIRYFMTTKINWNETNQMPYDTFLWQGLDGTKILTHFMPTREYIGPQGFHLGQNNYEKEYFTTYNGELKPSQVMGAWQRYQQKELNPEVLMAYGHGDGGGGPTREMLENGRRLQKGLAGCPKTLPSSALSFFKTLEKKVQGNRFLPTWVGELYLEYHRGTYTSMARNKKYNRLGEFACQNTELWCLLADILAGQAYPAEALEKHWKTLLLNQFHDILPGSSIREVYEESKEQYEGLLAGTKELQSQAFASIQQQAKLPKGTILVFHPNSTGGWVPVRLPWKKEGKAPRLSDGTREYPTQRLQSGELLFLCDTLPSKGYKSFWETDEPSAAKGTLSARKNRLENRFFRIELDKNGRFTRLLDKTNGREVLKAGEKGNAFLCYEDRPHNYDAWDINHYYLEKSWPADADTTLETVENGPVFAALTFSHRYLRSRIRQTIRIYADCPRIDLEHSIDWQEDHQLLKLHFPLDIHTQEATYDIQYGNVRRPTHSNTSWDAARFEVCMHKWLDLSEHGYGVSILNDCKYGVGVQGGNVGLTLLKAATYPNETADRERHHFCFSLHPHSGSWRESNTVDAAYALNNPPTACVLQKGTGAARPLEYSFLRCSENNVIIESQKKAEDGNGIIVRVYECWNRRTQATLTFSAAIKKAAECNLLEEEMDTLAPEDKCLTFEIRPYEIKTFRLLF
ncbi:glycosyl hydrolase-related protein [Ruminococcaceae bacterium OttesenSCG-928-I18]|nr:glycosyl hydrolase-related protein [Ruminococcaceae bacterium OttesenSCG-928-I18]